MKILVAQLAYLGDVILSTPIIGALKSKYPNVAIYLPTTPAGTTYMIQGLVGIIALKTGTV
ncbi:MAG: hypothetical protein R3A13_11145 [Bdellovibrionota bacterium]